MTQLILQLANVKRYQGSKNRHCKLNFVTTFHILMHLKSLAKTNNNGEDYTTAVLKKTRKKEKRPVQLIPQTVNNYC